MYRIIGSDQKEYGPVSADQLKQWLAEGRVNSQTRIKPEGAADWQPLNTLPEFMEELAAPSASPPPVPTTPSAPKPRTSGQAIASLVLGILSVVTCGVTTVITSPLGLILGLVSMNKIKKSQGQLGGRGMALAGAIISGVSLLMLPIFAAMLLPALASAKQKAQTINCVSNLKQLALAVRIYAADNKDRYPMATNWCDAIFEGVGTAKVFGCPAARGNARCYAFNAKLSGLEEGRTAPDTVMIFESDGDWNASGGPELAVTKPRHRRVFVVAMADGSVQQVTESRFKQLRWDP